MRNRRRNFTLVELLVVIGIIAILAGMLMAGIMYAPAKAQKAKAQAEITTLVNAIKQFESAYGVLPIPSGVSGDNIVLEGKDYRKMIGILQDAVKELQDLGNDDNNPWKGESDSNKDKDLKKNKRHSKFLDIQGNDPGQFTDPWGNDYYVVLDGDYNGKIVTDKIDGVNDKLTTLLDVTSKFVEALKQNDEKIEDLKKEIERRNPTDEEQINIRSMASYPYSETPKDFWDVKQKYRPNYTIMSDNSVSPDDEQKEFTLRRDDLKKDNDATLYKTLEYPLDLKDILDFEK